MSEKDKDDTPADPIDFSDPQSVMDYWNDSKKLIQQSQREDRVQRYETWKARLNDDQAIRTFVEQHLKLDTWLLHSEAISICQACDIDDAMLSNSDWATQVKQHIEAAKHTSLEIINPDEKPAKWRVKPVTFIKWLRSKELSPIAPVDKVLLDIADDTNPQPETTNNRTERFAANRERIFIAALAVLAEYPEKCSVNGKVSASAIVRMIEEKADLWFGYEDVPMSQRVMTELIRKALNTTR